ncbi:hypothetical protein M0813_07379 [Anaeramoeba flamelloides]|uniref:C3H1-type domain-containing protein n=1 Tax=Anaeramoeba flamelloides TaxID=1746091 RepID=A0ABQ8XB47_9EUKA|nr:hypothetical protein M0813_07379 [Anaeramoeba flamelloides]
MFETEKWLDTIFNWEHWNYTQINENTNTTFRPRIATFENGSFVTVWIDDYLGQYVITGKYNKSLSDSEYLKTEVQQISETYNQSTTPYFYQLFDIATISKNPENEFVVVFADENKKKIYLKIYQIDQENGNIQNTTDKIFVNTFQSVALTKIRISNIGNNEDDVIAITWEEYTYDAFSHLYVKLFSLNPDPKINSTMYLISDQLQREIQFPTSSIAKLGEKYFSVSWVDIGSTINLQLFNFSMDRDGESCINNVSKILKIDPEGSQSNNADSSEELTPIIVPAMANMGFGKEYENEDTLLLIWAYDKSIHALKYVLNETEQDHLSNSFSQKILQDVNVEASLPDVTWCGKDLFAVSFETCVDGDECKMEHDEVQKYMRAMVFSIMGDQINTKGDYIPYLEDNFYPFNKYSKIVDIGNNEIEVVYQAIADDKSYLHSQQIEVLTFELNNPISSPILFSHQDFNIDIPDDLFKISGGYNYQLSTNHSKLPDWFLSDLPENKFYGNVLYSKNTFTVEIDATVDICPITEQSQFDVKIIEYNYIDIKESGGHFFNPTIYLLLLITLFLL